MAGVFSRVFSGCGVLVRAVRSRVFPFTALNYSLPSNNAIPSLQTGIYGGSALYRTLSCWSRPSVISGYTRSQSMSLGGCKLFPGQMGCVASSLVPVRTVVKHSKLGKMKTVKAVAKRFRRTGSGKLKFWPPGNTHNLLSKSHDRKCRIRKARYVNKTQLKTLNKMLIGRYS